MKLTRALLAEKAALVADKLVRYDETTAEAMGKKGGLKEGVIARDFGISEWDWPQGVGLLGLCGLGDFFPDGRYDAFLTRWYENNLRRGLPARNINTTAPMNALLAAGALAEEPTYAALCLDWADWLMHGLPRTEEGGFQHVITSFKSRDDVSRNDGELWIDTLFMAVLFLSKMGVRFGREEWVQESIRQMLLHIKYLYDTKSGLFHHAWTFDGRNNFGDVLWLRGNSWYTLGALLYLEAAEESLGGGVRDIIANTWRVQVEALAALQSGGGLWHTVLDDPGSYLETSGSANIAAGMLKGVRMGLLDRRYTVPALHAIQAICERILPDGTVDGVSGGTVVGSDEEHYKTIIIAPMAYGQGLTLLALKEALLLAED